MRTTKKHVRGIFETLVELLPKLKPEYKYALTDWSPGDGVTRYRLVVIQNSNGAEHHLFGSTVWLGSGEAYVAMQAMVSALVGLDYALNGVRERKGI